jgi:hypothetical protein
VASLRKGRCSSYATTAWGRVTWQALEELLQTSHEVEIAMAEGTAVCVGVERQAQAESGGEGRRGTVKLSKHPGSAACWWCR